MDNISQDEKEILAQLVINTDMPLEFFERIVMIERDKVLTNRQQSCKGDIRELIEQFSKRKTGK